MSWTVQVMREVYRRELLPTRTLWWLTGDAMRDFFRYLEKFIAKPLAEAGIPDARGLFAKRAVGPPGAARRMA